MKKLTALCATVVLLLCSCSKSPSPGTAEATTQTVAVAKLEAAYVFKLKSVFPDENHKAMGQFHFRHSQPKPISLHGFWFVNEKGSQTETSNVFRVRFETFKRQESGVWADVPVGYCGTGAREYQIQPNQDYTFLIPLWPFVEKGTHGIVGLSGTGSKLESEPFETSQIKSIATSK